MININIYTETQKANDEQKKEISKFLHQHLEQFGDPEHEIALAISYANGENQKPGGLLLTSTDDSNLITGAVVINKTGMGGYIPENILVYIATDKNLRGQGIGKKLMQKAIETAQGDIALHCEPDNPARHLYEKLGFSSKYLEMRLKK